MSDEIKEVVREALEVQILEADPGKAAETIEQAARRHGIAEVAGLLLDTASIALRRMVLETDEAYDARELLERLSLDGAVPAEDLELLMHTLAFAAATAGGIRPAIEALQDGLGDQQLIFGAWLTVLTVLKVVSITIETTEAELVEELSSVLTVF